MNSRTNETQLSIARTCPVSTASFSSDVRPLNELGFADFYCGEGHDIFDTIRHYSVWWRHALQRGFDIYEMPMYSAPSTRVAVRRPGMSQPTGGLINFASYNYLGLSYREEVVDAAIRALRKYGLGSGGVPLLSGTTDLHEQLAVEIADFLGEQSALLFSTCYGANLSAVAGLMRPGDTVFADQFSHASLVDGISLSGIKPRFFRHNDSADLEKKLSRSNGRKLVVVEGVYSMDGDTGDLVKIAGVCQRHGARILVDEAHSAFVFGANGRGVTEQLGLCGDIDILMGTTSKALGGLGGYIAGRRELIDYLRAFGRPRIFSGALPPTIVAGLLEALKIVRSEPELRSRLWKNVTLMRKYLTEGGIDTGHSNSQIIPIMVRDEDRAFEIAKELFEEGVYICPIAYPAVAKNQSRLRMTISADHSSEEITRGAQVIISAFERYNLVVSK